MDKRSGATAETSRRIVAATLDLHARKGIFATSWQDIARAADVSVGTVYKHFPSLEQLVPACGELLMQKAAPPSADDITGIIGKATAPRERLLRVCQALFEFYHRNEIYLESDPRERELAAVREWEEHLRTTVTHFVKEAVSPQQLSEPVMQSAAARLDFMSFRAMRLRGISVELAGEMTADMLAAWLNL